MFDMERSKVVEAFDASIESINFGSMLVSRMRTQPFVYERVRRRISGDLMDHFMIRVDLENVEARSARPSAIVVIDLAQVSERNMTPSHNISVVLPRRVFGKDADALARLHQLPLTHASALFLADHLVSAMQHGAHLDGEVPRAIGAMLPTLVVNCLLDERRFADEELKADRDLMLLSKAKQIINDQLCSQKLNPNNLARQLGLSRSSLYRLFEPAGGVAKIIRESRMRAAARAIAEGDIHVRIGDVADRYCFSSDAQFSASFKTYFGCTPSEFRASTLETNPAGPARTRQSSNDRVFPVWLANL
ncbi:helix-turn-helix domain-containing protein [Rhizobium sp. L1K21]|uniref:helix-turn-helix domain-containing protein n=1 Tax=Rhizobium sp. L1K21 TaxID=2954933 RepID=UPI0020936184|nr:helix-turn-helix domain-containing protein [Rhizobium sp. L1K21]MCO6187926.1 helix-turn-helix domain-containing protein [Rhizobium sp. L1K21]